MQNSDENQSFSVHIIYNYVSVCPHVQCCHFFFYVCYRLLCFCEPSMCLVSHQLSQLVSHFCPNILQSLQYWYNRAVFLNLLKLCEEQSGFQSNTLAAFINAELGLAKYCPYLCKSWFYQKMFQSSAEKREWFTMCIGNSRIGIKHKHGWNKKFKTDRRELQTCQKKLANKYRNKETQISKV